MAYADDAKVSTKTRSRRWCFTSHDEKAPVRDASIQYMCYQREIAPTTGRQHWQGYVEFSGKGGIGMAAVKKRLGLECHLERTRGNASENRAYCSKLDSAIAGSFVEIGTPGEQGDRSDCKEIHSMVAAGWSNKQIATESPASYMRMYRGVDALRRSLMPERDPTGPMPKGYILFGEAGIGKTRWVWDKFGKENVFSKNNSKWWNGYTGQRVVVINEFKLGNGIDADYLKNLCDRYPFYVEDKGGMLPCSVEVVILTMNGDPLAMFGNDAAIWRRFELVKFEKDTDIITDDDVQAFFDSCQKPATAADSTAKP